MNKIVSALVVGSLLTFGLAAYADEAPAKDDKAEKGEHKKGDKKGEHHKKGDKEGDKAKGGEAAPAPAK